MPVLVTGATGLVGRALCARLLEEGGQVRAFVRHDDPALRALGVHVAIGDALDVPKLESALTRVHTIVHLVGGLFPERGVSYDDLNRDATEAAVIAARAADVGRFIFLSHVGADAGSSNEFLAAKGKAEEHIRGGGFGYAIFRCAPIVEGLPATVEHLRRGPLLGMPGSGRQRVTPVALADVVEAIVSADRREDAVVGVWELGGPDEMTFADAVAMTGVGGRVVPLGRVGRAPKTAVDVLARDLIADPRPVAAEFGLSLRRVGVGSPATPRRPL